MRRFRKYAWRILQVYRMVYRYVQAIAACYCIIIIIIIIVVHGVDEHCVKHCTHSFAVYTQCERDPCQHTLVNPETGQSNCVFVSEGLAQIFVRLPVCNFINTIF